MSVIRIEWSESVEYQTTISVQKAREVLTCDLDPEDGVVTQQIESASPEQLTEMIKDAGADLDSWLADCTGEDFMAVTDPSIDHVEVVSR